MLAAARRQAGRAPDWRYGSPDRSLDLRFPDGSAVRVLPDRVVLEAAGGSVRTTALRFASDYARQEEGWRSARDPDWSLPLPPAPGIVLAAAPRTLRQLFFDRLRRARLVTLHHDEERHRKAMTWLRQTYGDDWIATDQPLALERSEVILLVTPGCRHDIAADRGAFLRWARTLLRNHPGALALSLLVPGALPPLQPLAALLLEVEAALDRESGHPPPGTPVQPDALDEASPDEPAEEPDSDEPTPQPF